MRREARSCSSEPQPPVTKPWTANMPNNLRRVTEGRGMNLPIGRALKSKHCKMFDRAMCSSFARDMSNLDKSGGDVEKRRKPIS